MYVLGIVCLGKLERNEEKCVPVFRLVSDVRNTISEKVGSNSIASDSYSLCISTEAPRVFTEDFCGFPRSVQECGWISRRFRPIPSKSLPFQDSLVFLPFDTVLSEIPKKS